MKRRRLAWRNVSNGLTSVGKFWRALSVAAPDECAGNDGGSQKQNSGCEFRVDGGVADHGTQKANCSAGSTQTEVDPLKRALRVAEQYEKNDGDDEIYRGKSNWSGEMAPPGREHRKRMLPDEQLVEREQSENHGVH